MANRLNERERLRNTIAGSSADADSRVLGRKHANVDPNVSVLATSPISSRFTSLSVQDFHRRRPEISIEMKTTVINDDVRLTAYRPSHSEQHSDSISSRS